VDQRYPLRLTLVKETDAFHIYEIEFLQIQNDRGWAALDFAFDLVQMLKSKIAADSNPPAHRVNSQGHRIPAPEDTLALAIVLPLPNTCR
jgi:hypothetical protein